MILLIGIIATALMTGVVWAVYEKGWLAAYMPSNLSAIAILSAVLLFPAAFYITRLQAQVHAAEQEREESKIRDDMTHLYKFRIFKEMAQKQIRLCKRHGWPVSLVLIDIDQLKRINTDYEYDTGNQVLKKIASTVEEHIRKSDLIARVDDDRIAILLINCDAINARRILTRIQEHIFESPVLFNEEKVNIPFSIGVATLDAQTAKFARLHKRAEEALERAKRKGGRRIELY